MNNDESNQLPVEMELKKLGLDKKEADVYLACLDLRQGSVQNIAKMAKLSRPTCYRVIKLLEQKGLVRKTQRQKKTLVIAESPDEILGLLRSKKRRIEEQEREFLRIISDLKNRFYFNEKNQIRSFKGQEGVKYLLDDFSSTTEKEIRVIVFQKNNFLEKELENAYRSIRKRLGKISVRELRAENFSPSKLNFVERKKAVFPKNSPKAIILSRDAIILKNELGIVIKEETTVETLELMFETIWKSA
jgi:sugar-specific transcriptional regulator TrmB